MRNEPRKYGKSSSWPKIVMKKWLNIRSSSTDFLSDSNTHRGGGGGLERRKSCSDKDSSFLFTRGSLGTLSLSLGHGGWLVNTSLLDPIAPATQILRFTGTFVGTWNVGGKAPHEALDLRGWLLTSSPRPADLYIIGFQEIVPLNAGNVLGAEDKGPASTWLSLVRRALKAGEKTDGGGFGGGRYYLAASKQMVGIFLCVWAREGVAEHVRNVKVSCVGTGIMGYMGNKGSVSISMTIRRSTFCFVCSHLSSGEKEGDEARRNSDVTEILKRTSLSRAKEIAPTKILQHDKVIWLGDLNYRLAATAGCDNTTREMIEKNDWQALLKRDQLRIERGAGRILRGWEEGKISFPPTYKYLPNTDCYAFTTTKPGDKRRSPAWCDRILWRGNGMKQMSYSRDESRFSDHRPVRSLFSIEIDSYDHFQDTATATNNCSGNSSCSRVQAEELLVITRTQSCLSTTRF